ncbi:MAG: NEW3 domain-containing protein, partial [Chloroflexota bacterium]
QPETSSPSLTAFADYPARRVAVGDSVTFDITLRGGAAAEIVELSLEGLPEHWETTFRGGGDVIEAAHVEPGGDRSVALTVRVPEDASVDTHRFSVTARGEGETVEVPLRVVVQEKVPPSLTLEVELPTLKGKANTTFRYDATLKNEGNDELSVNLIAEAPQRFQVTFKLTGKEVTSFPIAPGESKRLDIEVQPPNDAPGGTYEIGVLAEGGAVRATTTLVADVTETPGEPNLNVTGPGGRLSGEATVGKETPLNLIISNTGDAPARNVELSASEPANWSVAFDPDEITEIPAGSQAEATAKITPAEKAVAGDYEITIRAKPEDGSSESAIFRITVRTSTMWGIVGVAIIGVAVVIVGLAVTRFGRR